MPERKLKPRNPRKLGREPSSERKPTVKHFADYRGHAVALPTYALPTDLLCAQAQLHAVACDKLARRANQWKPV